MPHIIIEHSANLADHHDIQALVDTVHDAVLAVSWVSGSALRTRAASRSHFRVADGDPSHIFVAVTVRIGPGRSTTVVQDFLQLIVDTVDNELSSVPSAIALSTEIQFIDAAVRINRNQIRAEESAAR